MMPLRPMVIDEKRILLGGNMRYKALKELNYKEVPKSWVKEAKDLSEDEKREFIIKDNVGFGLWDWDVLANEWNNEDLEAWGLDIPNFDILDVDYSARNGEIDVNEFEDNIKLILNYTIEDYETVKTKLLEIAITPEAAIWKLLGLNERV